VGEAGEGLGGKYTARMDVTLSKEKACLHVEVEGIQYGTHCDGIRQQASDGEVQVWPAALGVFVQDIPSCI